MNNKGFFQPFLVVFTLLIFISIAVALSLKAEAIQEKETLVGQSALEMIRTYEEAEITKSYIQRSLVLASEDSYKEVFGTGGFSDVSECEKFSNIIMGEIVLIDTCSELNLEAELISETHNILLEYLENFKPPYLGTGFTAIQNLEITEVTSEGSNFIYTIPSMNFTLSEGGLYQTNELKLKVKKPDISNFKTIYTELANCQTNKYSNEECKDYLEPKIDGLVTILEERIYIQIPAKTELKLLVDIEKPLPNIKLENIGTKTYILKTIA